MKTIYQYMKPYIPRMTLGLAVKLVGTLMDLVIPYFLAYVLDTVVPAGDVPRVYLCGGVMVVCALVAVTFNVGANRMAANVSKRIMTKVRFDLYARTMSLSRTDADRFSVPSLVSRLTSDTYNVHQMLDRLQRLGVRAPMLMLGGMIMTFLLEPALAVILLALAPLILLLVARVSKKGIPLYAAVQKSVDGLVRTVRENAGGVRVIKALSKSDYERTRFEGSNAAVTAAEIRAGRVMAITNPAMSLLLNAGLMLVVLVGAFRVNAGLMQPGKIIAFLSYFTIILNATLSVTKIFVLASRGAASGQRIAEVLDTPDDQPEGDPDHRETPYHITFSDVSFSYNGKRDNLSHVSFQLKRGQTLGLFGPTGSGKSTLASLLLRLYDADSGEIRISGDRVAGIPRDKLRAMFGVVFQSDVLLADTVFENISFLRGLSEEAVRNAAETAQAAEFIDKLDGGYSYKLDIRGANLSGGQRQRILIARALAGAPEILILDDAESALDYRTDAQLREAIRRSHGDATLIVISERVSALRSADLILVLDDGRVEAAGTHETLMQTCEKYRTVAEVQMGGADA